jgi:hypothetical protein
LSVVGTMAPRRTWTGSSSTSQPCAALTLCCWFIQPGGSACPRCSRAGSIASGCPALLSVSGRLGPRTAADEHTPVGRGHDLWLTAVVSVVYWLAGSTHGQQCLPIAVVPSGLDCIDKHGHLHCGATTAISRQSEQPSLPVAVAAQGSHERPGGRGLFASLVTSESTRPSSVSMIARARSTSAAAPCRTSAMSRPVPTIRRRSACRVPTTRTTAGSHTARCR